MRKLRLEGSSDASEVIKSMRGRGEPAPCSSSFLQATEAFAAAARVSSQLPADCVHPVPSPPSTPAPPGQTRHSLLLPEMVFPTPRPLLPPSLWLTSRWLLSYPTGLPIKPLFTLYNLDQIPPPQKTSRVSPPGNIPSSSFFLTSLLGLFCSTSSLLSLSLS